MFSQNLRCYICFKNIEFHRPSIRGLNATYTNTPVKTYLEQLSEQYPLTANENDLDEIILCEECHIKINDYDLACLTAKNIENDLRDLLKKSKKLFIKPEVIIKEEKDDVLFENEFQDDFNDGFYSSSDEDTNLNEIKKNTQLKAVCKRKLRTNSKNKTNHGENIKHCALCGFQTKTILTMELHMTKMHISEKQAIVYRCQKCRMTYKNQIDLDAHLEKHINLIPENPLQCVECGKILSSIRNLYTHILRHTGELPTHACEICGKEFNHNTSLRRHKAFHSNIKSKICNICGRICCDNTSLKRHLKTHKEVTAIIKKEECNDDVVEDKTQHLNDNNDDKINKMIKSILKGSKIQNKKKNGNRKKKLPREKKTDQMKHCALCGYQSKYLDSLKTHMKTHLNLKNEIVFRCEKCHMTYKNKADLDVHFEKHNNQIPPNPLQCVECDRIFTCRQNLYCHIPLHSGDFRIFVCELCGREFKQRRTFFRHKQNHLNIRTKECPTCGRLFSENAHLTKHIRTHTGEKPFACPVCDRRFANKYNMRSHMKLMHRPDRPESKMHMCIVCNKGFPQALLLKGHLTRAHQLAMDD